jgi:D-alanine-D-alanine ligase
VARTRYAQDCATIDGYEHHIAYVTPDGRWRFPTDLGVDALAAAVPMAPADGIAHVVGLGVDVMVPHMFCVPGTTTYRAQFDVPGIPYVGSTPAVTANKAWAKAIVAAAGVDVPPGELLRPGDRPTLAPPAVVKPADADNSLGVALVRSREDYGPALTEAFTHSPSALVERYVELGREVRCGVLVRDGGLVCLPLEECAVDDVRDHAHKIDRTADGGLRLAAKDTPRAGIVDPSDPVTGPVWEAARRCHVALGARHYSLFDFRIDAGGRPWFLEAGMYCSFSPKSVIAVMAKAAGIGVDELFRTALASALAAA